MRKSPKLSERAKALRMVRDKLIPVIPKNLRRVALHAIAVIQAPIVLMDGKAITDFSEGGPLTRHSIRSCIDFEIRDNRKPALGFHEHPNEMWITSSYVHIADHCAAKNWLKVQNNALKHVAQGRSLRSLDDAKARRPLAQTLNHQ